MCSFVLVYEIINKDKRTLYGALINGSFAIAGFFYYTAFMLLKDWHYIGAISCIVAILATAALYFYFDESPRFYQTMKKHEMCLKSLFHIALKNSKQQEFYEYVRTYVLQLHDRNEVIATKDMFAALVENVDWERYEEQVQEQENRERNENNNEDYNSNSDNINNSEVNINKNKTNSQ